MTGTKPGTTSFDESAYNAIGTAIRNAAVFGEAKVIIRIGNDGRLTFEALTPKIETTPWWRKFFQID